MVVRDEADADADRHRARALAMALHPRLGAHSLLGILSTELVRRIACFVSISHFRWLVAIHVRTGAFVDRIELRYTDGSVRACGGTGGEWREPFLLSPGESIKRVKCWSGEPELKCAKQPY